MLGEKVVQKGKGISFVYKRGQKFLLSGLKGIFILKFNLMVYNFIHLRKGLAVFQIIFRIII